MSGRMFGCGLKGDLYAGRKCVTICRDEHSICDTQTTGAGNLSNDQSEARIGNTSGKNAFFHLFATAGKAPRRILSPSQFVSLSPSVLLRFEGSCRKRAAGKGAEAGPHCKLPKIL